MVKATDDTFPNLVPRHDEDDFLRPEHDPESYVNRLAQEKPIISAPSVAFYALRDRFVFIIRRQPD